MILTRSFDLLYLHFSLIFVCGWELIILPVSKKFALVPTHYNYIFIQLCQFLVGGVTTAARASVAADSV
ncbi:hypothetical protein FB451DRAFT_1242449, partial [Mycena latifolia]